MKSRLLWILGIEIGVMDIGCMVDGSEDHEVVYRQSGKLAFPDATIMQKSAVGDKRI